MIKAGFDPSQFSSRQFAPCEVRRFNGYEIRRSLRWSKAPDAFMGVQEILIVKRATTTTEAAEEVWRRHHLISRLAMSVCRIWNRQHPHSTNPSLLLDMYPNPKDAAEVIGFEILDRIEKRKNWIKEITYG